MKNLTKGRYSPMICVLLFALICLTVSSCAGLDAPNEKIRNPKCTFWGKIKIIQVLPKGVLFVTLTPSSACGESGCVDTSYWDDTVFYIGIEGKSDAFEGEINNLGEDGICFYPKGLYKYTDTKGVTRTVRRFTSGKLYVTNPEYIEWQKEQSTGSDKGKK